MAKYAIAAEKQDRMWDMNSEIFEKQPKTEDEALKMAKSMGFDTIKLREDANSFETNEILSNDIEKSATLGILGTPTIIINGKIITGIKPYYELKELLIKAGAVEKN
jgi:protein-disulfide isomerase